MDVNKYYQDSTPPVEILSMMELVGAEPTLEEIWALMDLAWASTKASYNSQESWTEFYRHPVWTLNGFFTENHVLSIENREIFAQYITSTQPRRIADYGGGFGSLARLLAQQNPQATVEVVEPFPSELAVSLSQKYQNIVFVDELSGTYDMIVALDVLEHVPDPLELTHKLASRLAGDGYLLLANCFFPVIKCHLPCTFYLRDSFDFLTSKLGLTVQDTVLYGKVYKQTRSLVHPKDIKKWIKFAKSYYVYKHIKQSIKDIVKVVLGKNENITL